MKSENSLVKYYFERLEFYKNERGGYGYSMSDFSKAQNDVHELKKKIKNGSMSSEEVSGTRPVRTTKRKKKSGK